MDRVGSGQSKDSKKPGLVFQQDDDDKLPTAILRDSDEGQPSPRWNIQANEERAVSN